MALPKIQAKQQENTAVVSGEPNKKFISTSYVERQNLTSVCT